MFRAGEVKSPQGVLIRRLNETVLLARRPSMRHRLSFLVACLAIASLGLAGVLVATTPPVSANPEPRIEASPDASFSSVEAPPLEPATCSSCRRKHICTKDNQNCKW